MIILLLTTTSWIAPLLFLITIGVAVLINMGTNIFYKNISYITQSVSPILQLAVSLDYAIFLLSAFERLRQTEPNAEEAMVKAIRQSFVSIAASCMTTVFGFLALMFMRFRIMHMFLMGMVVHLPVRSVMRVNMIMTGLTASAFLAHYSTSNDIRFNSLQPRRSGYFRPHAGQESVNVSVSKSSPQPPQ